MSVLLSRAYGALTGLAVGDAVGTMNEFKWAGTFDPTTDMVGGRPFLLKPGQWMDDTSMVLCTMDFLLAQGRYDSFDVMDRHQRWPSEGYHLSTDRCSDIGDQVCAALFDSEHDLCVPATVEYTTSAGNGAIMRLAPVVIAGSCLRFPREVVATARLSACEMYLSIEAEAATEVFVALLVGALLDWSLEQFMDVSWASMGQPFDEAAARVISLDPWVWASWEAETSGYIVNGPCLAAHGLPDFPFFKDAILAIANMGGDSDTDTVIYGQLSGAFYGIEIIPALWKERVHQGEEIDELACALMDLQLEAPVTRFDEGLQDEASST